MECSCFHGLGLGQLEKRQWYSLRKTALCLRVGTTKQAPSQGRYVESDLFRSLLLGEAQTEE